MVGEAAKRKNPFVGPRPFTRNDKLYGREREMEGLFNLLISGRILLMYAPSGAGKTSLIQAALIPRMSDEGFHVLDNLRVNSAPGPSPEGGEAPNRYLSSVLDALEDACLGGDEGDGSERLAGAELGEMGLDGYLSRYHPQSPSLLIFDQFEEILTLNPVDIEAKRAFFQQVGQALGNPTRWALFSMREDYRSALDPYLEPLPTRLKTTFRLDLLTREAAEGVICKTTDQAGVDFQEPAARRLVEDLSRVQIMGLDGHVEKQVGPFVEPVQLQVVCYDLFERLASGDRVITVKEVKKVGNVDKALARYYGRQVRTVARQADPDQVSPVLAARQARPSRKGKKDRTSAEVELAEMVIRNWVDRWLITPGEVRNQLLMEEGSTKGLDNRTIDLLENAHLVRKDNRGGRIWIELAHDRLVGPVRQDNGTWFRSKSREPNRRATPWAASGALAVVLSYVLRGNLGWMALLLMGGSSILLFAQSYILTMLQTRELAMEKRNLWIYRGSRTLGVILAIANLLIFNAVIGLGFLRVSQAEPSTSRSPLLLFAGIAGGLCLMGIGVGYSWAKALSRFVVRLRLPYELGFFVGFVAISVAISAAAGALIFFLMYSLF